MYKVNQQLPYTVSAFACQLCMSECLITTRVCVESSTLYYVAVYSLLSSLALSVFTAHTVSVYVTPLKCDHEAINTMNTIARSVVN